MTLKVTNVICEQPLRRVPTSGQLYFPILSYIGKSGYWSGRKSLGLGLGLELG